MHFFHTDSQGLVEVINRKTTKDRQLLVLFHELVLQCLKHILFRAIHVPGVLNVKADVLSRLQVMRFKSLGQGMDLGNGKDHNNLIRLPQMESLVNDKRQVIALQLTILQYKHSNNGRPFTIYIHREVSCCPVKAILDFISTRGSFDSPLFAGHR